MPALSSFIQWCEHLSQSSDSPIAHKIVEIFHNVYATNRQGHVKQSFYGIKSFFGSSDFRVGPWLM